MGARSLYISGDVSVVHEVCEGLLLLVTFVVLALLIRATIVKVSHPGLLGHYHLTRGRAASLWDQNKRKEEMVECKERKEMEKSE